MQPWYAEWSNLSAEVAAAGGAGLAGDLFPEDDPPLGQVIRGHFDMDAVADDGADAVAPHLSGRVGDDPDLIVQRHSKPAVGQDLVDDALDGQQLFFRQGLNSDRMGSGIVVAGVPLATLEQRLAIGIVDHQPEPRGKSMNVAVGGSHDGAFKLKEALWKQTIDQGPWTSMLRRTIASSLSSPSAAFRASCFLRSCRPSSVSFSLNFRTTLTSSFKVKSDPADWLPGRFL